MAKYYKYCKNCGAELSLFTNVQEGKCPRCIIVNRLISEGVDEDEAYAMVDNLQDYTPVLPDDIVDYTAVFNHSSWCVNVINSDIGSIVANIFMFAGELNHYKSGTAILISLLYDSSYPPSELGIE